MCANRLESGPIILLVLSICRHDFELPVPQAIQEPIDETLKNLVRQPGKRTLWGPVLGLLFATPSLIKKKVASDPINDQPERRASKRFSIDRRIRYRVVGRRHSGVSGNGKTVNMSSVGILIATDQILSYGWRMEVEVEGPFQVDDQVFSKLVVRGTIVRTETSPVPLAVVKITGHEFRTMRDSSSRRLH